MTHSLFRRQQPSDIMDEEIDDFSYKSSEVITTNMFN